VAGGLVHAKPRSREGKRKRTVDRGPWTVWRAADGSLRVVLSVARAFQPEFCRLGLERWEIAAWVRVRWQAIWFTRSREAAKGNAKG